jgi:hypothetical protein
VIKPRIIGEGEKVARMGEEMYIEGFGGET